MAEEEPSPGKTMEDSIITLPVLAEGVVALGDLWDCRSSTCPGTILEQPLSKEYAEVHPMRALDYTLRKIQNTKDKINELHLSAEITLEALDGKLKIHGAASYDAEDVKKFNEEELHCEYLLHTYKLRLRPNVKDIFNKSIVDKITGQDPTIAATHYVQEVLIGAHVMAKIKYAEKIDKDNYKVMGSFDGKLELGAVSVEVKMSLEMLDTDEEAYYETNISLKASPPLPKTPTKVSDMFTEIEKIDQTVRDEEHYADIFGPKPRIYGVPLSFKLAPLSQLFDEKLIGYYEIMKQEILDAFLEMICHFQDFQAPDYIKSLIVRQCPPIVTILRDPYNEYTERITAWEIYLQNKSKELKSESFILFGEYKEGEKNENDLSDLIDKNNDEFNLPELYEKMYAYVKEGKALLTAIHSSDTLAASEGKMDDDGDDMTTRVQFFTNKEDLEDWWSQERSIKLLMETKSEPRSGSTAGTFIKLFDMTATLVRRYGVEVGVALPNISKSHSLTFKIGSREVCYSHADGDLQFALDVLAIAIDKGPLMASLFHGINNALSGVYHPYDLRDITSLVSIMRQYSYVTICESYVQLLEQVAGTPNAWLFVLPLEATHSASDAVRFFRQVRLDFPAQQPDVEHKWIVGRFNSTAHEAPLLLVFRNGELQAVCMDHLDILILLQQFKAMRASVEAASGTRTLLKLGQGQGRSRASDSTASGYPDLAAISPQNVRPQCFYPERANFILPLIENLVIHQHQSYLYAPVADLPSFPRDVHPLLSEAVELLRGVCLRREVQVLSAVARHAIANGEPGGPNLGTQVLEPGAMTYGWRSSKQTFVSTSETWAWDDLSKELDTFIAQMAPYLNQVQLGIRDLQDLVKRVEYVPPPPPSPVTPPPEPSSPEPSSSGGIDDDDDSDSEGLVRVRAPKGTLKAPEVEVPTDDEVRKEVDDIIKSIKDSNYPEYTALKEQLESLEHVEKPQMKMYRVLNLLQVFYAKELTAERFHYLGILKTLVDNLALATNTIRPLYQHVVERYVGRLLDPADMDAEQRSRARARARLRARSPGTLDENTVVITEEDFPSAPKLLFDSVTDENFYKTLTLLVKCTQASRLFKLHLELYNLASVTSPESMKNTVERMHEWKFGEPQRRDVWLNTKFTSWIGHGLANGALLETIKFRVCVSEDEGDGNGGLTLAIPHWLPHAIADKLKPLFYGMELQDYPWNKDWADIESVVQVFQGIVTRGTLPLGFMANFQQNVVRNAALLAALQDEYEVLYFWSRDEGIFREPWSVRSVATALGVIMGKRAEAAASKTATTLSSSVGTVPGPLNAILKGPVSAVSSARTPQEWIITFPEEEPDAQPLVVNKNWRHLAPASGKVPQTAHKEWNTVARFPPRPFIQNEHQLPSTLATIVPYLLSAFLKMGDSSDFAETSRVASFLNYVHWTERGPGPRPGYIEFLDSDEEDFEQVKKFLLSRGDLLTAVCGNLSDTLLTLHFCRTLLTQLGSRLALPVIVPAVSTGGSGSEPGSPKSLLPLLRQIYISGGRERDVPGFESGLRPLLDDNSRFITAIRVGEAPTSGRVGKSTILNQHILNNENFFSCRLESGCENGPPVQRAGLVECTLLSRATCGDGFWEAFGFAMENQASSPSPDVYLANLHGDAVAPELANTLRLLDRYSSSFIIFWRAANWNELKAKKKEMNALIGNKPHVLNLIVDPDETILAQVPDEQNIIYTSRLDQPSTSAKLYNVFKEAFRCTGKLEDVPQAEAQGIELVSIRTTASTALLDFIQENTASTIRKLFQLLQTTLRQCTDEDSYKLETETLLAKHPLLARTLTLFVAVLNLPLRSRFAAFTHLQAQLEQQSQMLRQRYVERIVKLEGELLGYVRQAAESKGRVALDEEYITRLQKEIKGVRVSMNSMSLELSQFWKQLDYVVPLVAPSSLGPYQDTYVQLAKVGWSLQLLDGDEGDGAADPELHASFRTRVLDHIFLGSGSGSGSSLLPPEARIFVVSVLGLRSSGKSTLLNSIFGNSCGTFATGSAGCTRGLVFRLHRLTPELSAWLKLDVILVIDSEGLGAADSYLDEAANVYEREMVTFLLGVSHLTLVHVVDAQGQGGAGGVGRGRGYDELGPILEVALTTLTGIAEERPTGQLDILFVHESNESQAAAYADGGGGGDGLAPSPRQLPDPPFLTDFKESLDYLTHFTQSKENELLLGVRTGLPRVVDTIMQRVRHDEIVFSTGAGADTGGGVGTGVAGGLFNKILDICSQSTENRIGVEAWYQFKNEFYEKVQRLGRGQMAASVEKAVLENVPRRLSPLLYKGLAELQDSADILRKMQQVKKLIDLAYRHHAGAVEAEIDSTLRTLYTKDDDLSPYPPEPVNSDEAKEKALEMTAELEKQGSIFWMTINTCEGDGNNNSEARARAGKFKASGVRTNEDGGDATSSACRDCAEAYNAREALIGEIRNSGLLRRKRQIELIDHIGTYQTEVRDTTWFRIQQKVFATQLRYRCVPEVEVSPDTPLTSDSEKVVFVSNKVTVIPAWRLVQDEVLEEYCAMPPAFLARVSGLDWHTSDELPDLQSLPAFDLAHYNRTTQIDESALSAAKTCRLNWVQCDWLKAKIDDLPAIIATERDSKQYVQGMVRNLQNKVVEVLADFEVYCEERLDINFQWEAHLYAILVFARYMRQTQMDWNENESSPSDPLHIWAKLKELEAEAGITASNGKPGKVMPHPQGTTAPSMPATATATAPGSGTQKPTRAGGWVRR